jgi:hypothetical protein
LPALVCLADSHWRWLLLSLFACSCAVPCPGGDGPPKPAGA